MMFVGVWTKCSRCRVDMLGTPEEAARDDVLCQDCAKVRRCKCERPIASSKPHVCKTCGGTVSLARAVWTDK